MITVTAQYLKVATSEDIVLFIGSRLAITVSVLYSDSDATSFVATVSSSDSPGVVQSFVAHIHDSRPANFLIKFTGRQTATCLRNCVASASQGSSAPIIVRLSFFSLVTRSNQLRCSVSSLSSCSVELSNSSSSFTFIEIKVGPLSGSARFQNGILSSVATVSANDDSASFQLNFLRSPTVVSAAAAAAAAAAQSRSLNLTQVRQDLLLVANLYPASDSAYYYRAAAQ